VTEFTTGFEPTLATNQIIEWPIGFGSPCDRDRAFQANLRDILNDLGEDALIANPWIQDRNTLDWNHLDSLRRCCGHYAAFLNGARIAIL
jgi:hypothetical protein